MPLSEGAVLPDRVLVTGKLRGAGGSDTEVATQETLCPPRLSNGSEWLFHGKDEVSAGLPSPDPHQQRGRWKGRMPLDLLTQEGLS